MKYYFISYAHPRGFGSCHYKTDKFSKQKVEKALSEEYELAQVCLVFYKELSEQEYKEFI